MTASIMMTFSAYVDLETEERSSAMPTESCIDVLKIRELVTRARQNGMSISEYTVRRAIRSGRLPCRIVGNTYLISWKKFVEWVTCSSGCDNPISKEKGLI